MRPIHIIVRWNHVICCRREILVFETSAGFHKHTTLRLRGEQSLIHSYGIRTCVWEAGIKGKDKHLHATDTAGCNYLSVPLIPASDTNVFICTSIKNYDHQLRYTSNNCMHPDSKVHGANIGPIWGRPCLPHEPWIKVHMHAYTVCPMEHLLGLYSAVLCFVFVALSVIFTVWLFTHTIQGCGFGPGTIYDYTSASEVMLMHMGETHLYLSTIKRTKKPRDLYIFLELSFTCTGV